MDAESSSKGKGPESPRHSKAWYARWHDDTWYCICPGNNRARYLKVAKLNENHGRFFWKCYNRVEENQCPCFIWADDEDEAREWLAKNGRFPPVGPQTPNTSTRFRDPAIPKTPETPWTRAKRRAVSPETSDDENDNPSPGTLRGDEIHGFEFMDLTPSRKSTKATRFATPSQPFNPRPMNGEGSIPTPDNSNRRAPSGGLFARSQPHNPAREVSPTPGRLGTAINLDDDDSSNLTLAVLRLLRSENIELREEATTKMGHKIDMAMELQEIEISRLSKRVAELEGLVARLRGVNMNNPIDLCD